MDEWIETNFTKAEQLKCLVLIGATVSGNKEDRTSCPLLRESNESFRKNDLRPLLTRRREPLSGLVESRYLGRRGGLHGHGRRSMGRFQKRWLSAEGRSPHRAEGNMGRCILSLTPTIDAYFYMNTVG